MDQEDEKEGNRIPSASLKPAGGRQVEEEITEQKMEMQGRGEKSMGMT